MQQHDVTRSPGLPRHVAGLRLAKAAMIGIGIVLLALFANGEQAAFIYQNF